MVTFVCSNCNNSMRKSQVPTHRCGAKLSCVECGNMFDYTNYKSHNQCLSNGAVESFGTDAPTKGLKKQISWTTIVSTALEEYSSPNKHLMSLVDFIKDKVNIPQKENKFKNFIKSTMYGKYISNAGDILWVHLLKYKQKFEESTQETTLKRPLEKTEEPEAKKQKTDEKVDAEIKKKKKKESSDKIIIENVDESIKKDEGTKEAPKKKKKSKKNKSVEKVTDILNDKLKYVEDMPKEPKPIENSEGNISAPKEKSKKSKSKKNKLLDESISADKIQSGNTNNESKPKKMSKKNKQ